MDWNRVVGSWKQLEGKVKAKWGLLTDDDLMTIKGSRELLVGKLQERYGIARTMPRNKSTSISPRKAIDRLLHRDDPQAT